MDDSDDYFGDDDFIIDDETAAALDATERRHATQAPPPPPRLQPPVTTVQPPSKKLKTNIGWTPGFGSRADSLTDLDDLPEISIQGNSYAISSTSGASSSHRVQQPEIPAQRPEPAFQYQRPQTDRQRSVSAQPHRPISAMPVPNVQRIGYNPPRRPPPPPQVVQAPPRVPPGSNYNGRVAPTPAPVNSRLEEELRQLQQKLEELRQSNDKMRAELTSAMDAKMAKEGEVTILRKNIEKSTQNHSTELAKLRAAKEEADAQILRIQKTNKEELERLRTQFIFKQQDLEANMRKPPPSTRVKKIMSEIPSTPLSAIPGRSNWGAMPQPTPSKGPLNWGNDNPKIPSPRKGTFKSPEKARKPMLPGFQNAFAATSTPLPSQRNKGKAKAMEPKIPSLNFTQSPPPTIPQQSQSFSALPPLKLDPLPDVPSQPTNKPSQPRNEDVFADVEQRTDQDGDVFMDEEEPVIYEDCGTIDATNWKAELSRIMLTHVHPSSGQLTLQLLLGAKLEDNKDYPAAPQVFMEAYSSLINALSSSATMENYDQTLDIASSACVTLAQVLCSVESIEPLISLLNLLAVAVIYIPKFRSHLYRHSPPNDPNACRILDVTYNVFFTHLSPKVTDPFKISLGVQLLEFLEALCFQSSDHEVIKFSKLLRDRTIITTLLEPSQPLPFLQKSVRVLVLLSTHAVLYRDLLAISDRPEDDEETAKNGILDRICTLLAESNRDGTEYLELRRHLLSLLAQLSLAHSDAHAELMSSTILLPSLVFHLHQITAPIFEEDEQTAASDEETLFDLVKFIAQCVYLIRHLVMSTDPDDNLYKLQHPPYRGLKSAPQMFVVTFSHLAWVDTDAIVWLSERCKRILARLKAVAEFVFTSVIEGPEGDDVQFTLQDATLASSDDDAPRMDVEPEQMEAEFEP